MEECRTRLTTKVVTGKLDIRNAAARLPENASEWLASPLKSEEAGDDPEVKLDT